jgi:hypothetical protein
MLTLFFTFLPLFLLLQYTNFRYDGLCYLWVMQAQQTADLKCLLGFSRRGLWERPRALEGQSGLVACGPVHKSV